MPDERPKVSTILDSALEILRDHGDHGLSMRKVAERAGISLGHLQHYFPTKNDVLEGLVGSHFEVCTAALREHVERETATDARRVAAGLVDLGFAYVRDEDTCRVFRELWALSSRNAEVREHLERYYREYSSMLVAFLRPVARSRTAARRAVALLLPWFDGYSVTASSLDLDEAAMARQLTGLVVAALDPGKSA
ncbi:MAG: TetR/AcrR family transcriptional regulator [Planctomycetota bacterium]